MGKSLRAAAVLAAAIALVPAIGQARFDPTCGRDPADGGRPIFAHFVQPADGQLIVATQAGGLSATAGNGQAVFVSTTGFVDVIIDFSCMMNMTLTVTQVVPGTQAPIVVDITDQDLNGLDDTLPCAGPAQITVPVEIGLNAGTYEFQLSGFGCNGAETAPTSGGGTAIDPPLPL